MAGKPIDLHYPDTYHRVKRTLMLFCAAVIVLAFAHTPDNTMSVGTAGATTQLDANVLRFFLWVAAAYYAYGFYNEVRILRRLNSEVLRGDTASSLDASLRHLTQKLEPYQTSLPERLAEYQVAQEERISRLLEITAGFEKVMTSDDEFLKELANTIRGGMGHHLFPGTTYHETAIKSAAHQGALDILNRERVRLAALAEALGKQPPKTSAPVSQQAIDMISNLTRTLDKTRAEFEGFANAIDRERQASFYYWEIGGAAIMFVLATIAMAGRVGPALQAWAVG